MQNTKKKYYIGVDGGATKSIVRIEDEDGNVLGRQISGPANIRISVEQAWRSINAAIQNILQPLNIKLDDADFYAGMGLAGCELEFAFNTFVNTQHHFKSLVVTSDAHTACLGAHAGKDGAIIIIGTGVIGFQIKDKTFSKVGGWGFPHDDEGGGAWLGLEVTKLTLQCLDGRKVFGPLAQKVYARFENNTERFVTWANQANSTAFAELAPIVIEELAHNDNEAIHLMQQAAIAVEKIAHALNPSATYSLVGGLSVFVQPFLNAELKLKLQDCQFTPDVGAILLVKG